MVRKAFITGGSGFIGLNVVAQLIQEDWEVTALVQPHSNITYLQRFPIKLVEGDIRDIASLRKRIPQGLDAVFHLAGDTNYWSKRNARQTAIHVDGTRNMIRISLEKGVRSFIYTSSVAAWGEVDGLISEQIPQKGQESWIHYDRTKWLGEQEALKGIEQGMKVVILNPATVVGPYDITSWGKVFMMVKNDAYSFSLPGCASFGHAREVARAHVRAVDKGQNGHRYILGGEPNTTYVDFFREVANVLGKSKVAKPLPPRLLKALGYLMVGISGITGKVPMITPEFATVTSRKNRIYSSEKAVRELGYRIVPMKTCVTDCYQWLLKEGLL